ncbi:hypothetical protein OIU85_009878 [Salix viminalis]|uniref:Uncharacterized protein n=1 Tax=Salix viminalis TaxID=40686 RepID=A0A9Q0NVE9_SALVM|nr:hypothetical protein OIU85_009878 [Salix viminalis]
MERVGLEESPPRRGGNRVPAGDSSAQGERAFISRESRQGEVETECQQNKNRTLTSRFWDFSAQGKW